MAAYRRVCRFGLLRADCRGPASAPEYYARFEYETTFFNKELLKCRGGNPTRADPAIQGDQQTRGLIHAASEYFFQHKNSGVFCVLLLFGSSAKKSTNLAWGWRHRLNMLISVGEGRRAETEVQPLRKIFIHSRRIAVLLICFEAAQR